MTKIRNVSAEDNFPFRDADDDPMGDAEEVFRSFFYDDLTGSVQWGVVREKFGCLPADDTDWVIGMNQIIDILNSLIILPQKPSEQYVRSKFGI